MKKVKVIFDKPFMSVQPGSTIVFFDESILNYVQDFSKFETYYELASWFYVTFDQHLNNYFHNDTGPAFSYRLEHWSYPQNEYYLKGERMSWTKWKTEKLKWRKKIKFDKKMKDVLK